jgi:non-homologous end joining protein Ku
LEEGSGGKPERAKIPPTVEMVKKYCDERKNSVDPSRFIDYYEGRGWMMGKYKMKNWQAAVRTWEGRQKDRPNEQVDDFIEEPRSYDMSQI